MNEKPMTRLENMTQFLLEYGVNPKKEPINTVLWHLGEAERELAEAREELQDWKDAAKSTENPHPDEAHCACVPLLRGLIAKRTKQRDKAWNLIADIRKDFERDESFGQTVETLFSKPLEAAEDEARSLCEQRDRLAEALRKTCQHMRHSLNCHARVGLFVCNCGMDKAEDNAREALAAVKGEQP